MLQVKPYTHISLSGLLRWLYSGEKVKVFSDQDMVQLERNPHSKNRDGEN